MATQTPAHAVPGAFLSTPALASRTDPVRRRLFTETASVGGTSSSLASRHAPVSVSGDVVPSGTSGFSSNGAIVGSAASQPSPANAPASLPPILKAARAVNQVLQRDESYPEIDSFCRPGASSDYDLPSADSSWAPFQRVNMYPIPDKVFDNIQRTNVNIIWGLFAEIGYAYIALDNTLLMWNFSQPHPDVIGFEDQPHVIRAVALVPPKPNVFLSSITHILVVATTSDIILLGLSATPNPNGHKSVALYLTKMIIHAPSSNINLIAGTAGGRIFFGGDGDTDVHELCYQKEEKWFSGRCHRVNHSQAGWGSIMPRLPPLVYSTAAGEHLIQIIVDDSRSLLYTLSNKSTIRTYHIEGPDKLTKVIEKTKNHCLRDLTHTISPSLLLTERMSIVAISPISAQEAFKLHLMALTDTGCRLYLSATSAASYMMGPSSPNTAPQSMQVQFVKFPPKEFNRERRSTLGFDSTSDMPLDGHSQALQTSKTGFRFAPGYFFDFVTKPDDPNTDLLFASAPETGRIKHTVAATALKFYEHANWVELGKGRALAVGLINQPVAATNQPLGFGNELAVQFDGPPCDAAVLTNSGVCVVRRRRLVDIFATTVRTAVGDEVLEREVRKFIHLYGRVETVSSALAVACGQGNDLRTGTSRVIDHGTADRAKMVFVTFGGQPTLVESEGSGSTPSTDSIRLSARHDALALYLTRLVRILWKAKVINAELDKTGGWRVNSTIPMAKLTIVQENLERLRNFLNTNKGIIQGLSGPADLQRVASRQEEVALQAEHQALHALQKLMESISEGISFVLMLFDERVADIYARLISTNRAQLTDLTYETLFSQSGGKELAKLLVKAIVNRNIESGSNVETVADALRRRCGSFCSPDDVVIFKAQEQLKRASEQATQPNVQRTLLNESLRLFQRVAGSLSFANLEVAVEHYTDLKYYAGAIELCLVVAKEKDRGNSALAWINENKPANDPRMTAFHERKRCYDLIHLTLEQLDAASSAEPELIDGKPTLTATKRMEAYTVVNDSDDEVFHFDLYEWYILQNWTDRILAIESPHVVTFLKRLAASDARHADLLCRFYTHRGLFFEAAQVQYTIACSDFEVGIKDRITLLSRAKGNASVSTPGSNRLQQQQLIHEITEMLDIAHIQDDLLERLKADARLSDDRKAEVVETLDGPIQGLTELFNTYADPGGYYDLCLLVFHAADYHQPRAIADTWRNLIDSTHQDVEERIEAYRSLQDSGRLPAGAEPPPFPYEAVSMHIQAIAHRTSLDAMVFPVDTLFPAVCEYAVNQGQDQSMGADNVWPVLLFLQLGVSQPVLARMLERLFDAQEAPFTGRRGRRLVVEWVNATIESWLREVERQGLGLGGLGAGEQTTQALPGGREGALATWVGDLLARAAEEMVALAGALRDRDAAGAKQELEEVARRSRYLRLAVDKSVKQQRMQGSFRFM